MTVRTSADIHFGPGDLSHRWHPGSDSCQPYGVLKFGDSANVFVHDTDDIDAAIAELVALRAEMTAGTEPEAESSYDLAIRQAAAFARPGNTMDDILKAAS